MKKAILSAQLDARRLYSEQEMAALFGVSRAPVRDATIRLSNEGLIHVLSNRGMQVVELGPQAIAECYEMREILEGWVVQRLAKCATDEQRNAIRASIERQRRIVVRSDFEAWVAENAAFHLLLATMAGNARIAQTIGSIGEHMQRVGRTLIPKRRPMKEIFDEHAVIVDYILKRSAAKADLAMKKHLADTARAFVDLES
ncbi:GntR family transcriptional regulator [Pseudorhodoplanes sp.]|uniref:GntR family transcriptional regulator n=1 Tax=Pseudorhodoplanes sp. TaxID=1934341 RepID=UPI003D1168CB